MAKTIVRSILGILFILAAVGHIFNPEPTSGFIPEFLPKTFVHIIISIVEGSLGIGVFIPYFRQKALVGIIILMLLLLPLHIIDLFRDKPVIGSMTAAIIRIPIQFLLIYLAWFGKEKEVKK